MRNYDVVTARQILEALDLNGVVLYDEETASSKLWECLGFGLDFPLSVGDDPCCINCEGPHDSEDCPDTEGWEG